MFKKRNSRYYHLAKGLKECLYVFGQSHKLKQGLLEPLRGPFFTGMSFVMTMGHFGMKLFGPTSTTMHKEVAVRFADKGMLIEFQNDKCEGKLVRGFDVAWISKYGLQEDERCDLHCSSFSLFFKRHAFYT